MLVGTSCAKEFSVEHKLGGTLKDAQGICLPSAIHGVFFKDISLDHDTGYIEVQVNVALKGKYLISTNIQNGFQFAASGTFNTTGLQVIHLKPSGKPVDTGYTNFTVCYDTSCCPFNVFVDQTHTEDLPDNAWQYTDLSNGKTFRGNFNATQYVITPVSTLVSLRKQIVNSADTSFEISFTFPPDGIKTGSFMTNKGNAMSYSHSGICVNCAWEVAYNLYGAITNIVITNYNVITRTIQGTFSGTTINEQNELVPIKDGKFKTVIK